MTALVCHTVCASYNHHALEWVGWVCPAQAHFGQKYEKLPAKKTSFMRILRNHDINTAPTEKDKLHPLLSICASGELGSQVLGSKGNRSNDHVTTAAGLQACSRSYH